MVRYLSMAGVTFIAVLIGLCASYETVEPGYEAVGIRFGEVTGEVLGPGLHVVNPVISWDHFSTLYNSTTFEGIEVPAADQQTATMDVSVQWRIAPGAPVTLREDTGDFQRVFDVHFVPTARGALRDAGRATKRVEDFYSEEKILAYRSAALEQLRKILSPKGIEISDVIVRKVSLPNLIQEAITAKKEREQQVERERAELDRVRLVAQQQVAKADANLEASERDAKAVKIKAEAEAYKIEKLQEQLRQSPNYVELVKAERWNGTLPQVVGESMPLLDLRTVEKK